MATTVRATLATTERRPRSVCVARRHLLLASFSLGLIHCGPSASTSTTPPRALGETRSAPALAPYLPGAGFSWLVQVRPREIMACSELLPLLNRLASAERWAAFVARTGADPAQIDEAWLGHYALGDLWLFDGRRVGARVEQLLLERARSTSKPKLAPPLSYASYVVSDEPGAYLRDEAGLFAVAQRDPSLTRLVRARAEGKLSSKAALETVDLAPLAALDPSALARYFFRAPSVATDALSAELASGSVSLRVEANELRVAVALFGGWAGGATELAQSWDERAAHLLGSPLGRRWGSAELLAEPQFVCAPPPAGEARLEGTWLCQSELRLPLSRWLLHLDWLSAETLGELVGEESSASPAP